MRLAIIVLTFFWFATAAAQISTESVDSTGLESVDGTGLESVDGTGTESVDGTGTESVDGTGTESADISDSQSYVVQSGDTLGSIAARFLGSTAHWKQIFAANTDVLDNANSLPVGVTLTIPAAD